MGMSFCRNCGEKVNESQNFCTSCGSSLKVYEENEYQNYYSEHNVVEDKAGCFTIGIAFLIPLVGLVLYLVWAQSRPQSAKSIGFAAIIGFIVDIIIWSALLSLGVY